MSAHREAENISWLNLRTNLAFVAVSRSWLDNDVIAGMLVSGIFTGNVEHVDSTTEGTRQYLKVGSVPDDLRRPVNAMSVAASVGIPRETARSKLKTLARNGFLITTDEGVIISTNAIVSGALGKATMGYLAAFDDFLIGLTSISACGLSGGSRFSGPLSSIGGAVLRLGSAHVLRTTNAVQSLSPDAPFVTKYVLTALCHLVSLDLRIGEAMPGDVGGLAHLKPRIAPVSGGAVVRFTGLPEETVRRHLRRLVDMGDVIRTPQGYDVNLGNPDLVVRWRAFQARTNISTRQFISKTKAAGLLA